MTMALLLPWFPILLGVGIGGRLLGRKRGFALGFLCALFWIVLAQASEGLLIWRDPWTVIALITGAVAIFTIGGWAGLTDVENPSVGVGSRKKQSDSAGAVSARDDTTHLESLRVAMDQFGDWLEGDGTQGNGHASDSNPWGHFDEFLRGVLYRCCHATHVRPYRLLSEGEDLVPLTEPDPFAEVKRLSARRGIIGHVLTTGRSFLAGDADQGELLDRLAGSPTATPPDASRTDGESIAWCFAIRQGTRRLGAVTVGHLDLPPDRNRELLRTTERLVTQFWCRLTEVARSRTAMLDDPVSGFHTREAFLRVAEQSLRESYDQAEPVAVGIIALEGVRALNDSGRWEIADELIRQVAGEMRRKLRVDDRLGRFDGARFVLLLRRVDSALASLIVSQLIERLKKVCGDERWHEPIKVRCGVVGSGIENPDLRTLISKAVARCHRARLDGMEIASDLDSEPALASGGIRL